MRQAEEFERQPYNHAGNCSHPETDQEIQYIDRPGKCFGGETQEDNAAENGSDEVCRKKATHVANGNISPPASIRLEEMKHEDFQRYPDSECRDQVGPVRPRYAEVKSQEKRENS